MFILSSWLGGGVHELKSINLSLSQEQRSGTSNSKRTVGGFKVGMKLEAKDRLHPTLVCVATIADIKDEQLLIHFDGWSVDYDCWCKPDSTDLHPKGWCSSHRVKLQAPAGINTLGLSGSHDNKFYLEVKECCECV